MCMCVCVVNLGRLENRVCLNISFVYCMYFVYMYALCKVHGGGGGAKIKLPGKSVIDM